jgi:hypothetical protein
MFLSKQNQFTLRKCNKFLVFEVLRVQTIQLLLTWVQIYLETFQVS